MPTLHNQKIEVKTTKSTDCKTYLTKSLALLACARELKAAGIIRLVALVQMEFELVE